MRLERTYGFSQSDFIDSFQPESEGKFPAFHTTTLRTLLCWTEGHLPVAEHSFIASSRQQASKAITLVEIVGWCTEARSSCAITCQVVDERAGGRGHLPPHLLIDARELEGRPDTTALGCRNRQP
jgi:hypothetical protein